MFIMQKFYTKIYCKLFFWDSLKLHASDSWFDLHPTIHSGNESFYYLFTNVTMSGWCRIPEKMATEFVFGTFWYTIYEDKILDEILVILKNKCLNAAIMVPFLDTLFNCGICFYCLFRHLHDTILLHVLWAWLFHMELCVGIALVLDNVYIWQCLLIF